MKPLFAVILLATLSSPAFADEAVPDAAAAEKIGAAALEAAIKPEERAKMLFGNRERYIATLDGDTWTVTLRRESVGPDLYVWMDEAAVKLSRYDGRILSVDIHK